MFPRLQDILFILIFLFLILFGSNLFRDGDPGRHITVGNYMIENRTIVTSDIFSTTMAGQPITPHEWLAQLAFGVSYKILGLAGVVFLISLVISISIVLVYREVVKRGIPHLWAIFLAIWCAAMTSAHWLARPHVFTFLFLALWTPGLLQLSKGEKKTIWQFPLIMLIWANTHGAFIAGFLVWGAIVAGWVWEHRASIKAEKTLLYKLILTGVVAFLATFFNPAGWKLWATSIGYITNRYLTQFTQEYRSLDFHNINAWPFLIFVAVSFIILTRSWKKLPLSESFLLASWFPLALYSGRNMPLFAIIAVPIMAGYSVPRVSAISFLKNLVTPIKNLEIHLKGFLWSFIVVLTIFLLLFSGHKLDYPREGYNFNSSEFPVAAVAWLENNPQNGNMFNFCRWGGYLLYRQWPQQNVFIDGQTDFYGETLTRQYEQVISAQEGWKEILDSYQVQWMIIPPGTSLALKLYTESEWVPLYQDTTTVIFRHQ
jgi:hypothetical protein